MDEINSNIGDGRTALATPGLLKTYHTKTTSKQPKKHQKFWNRFNHPPFPLLCPKQPQNYPKTNSKLPQRYPNHLKYIQQPPPPKKKYIYCPKVSPKKLPKTFGLG